MAGNAKKWLIGCGVGCGLIIVLGIILSVVGAIVMTRPFNDAVDTQQELAASYGERDKYSPPPGEIDADRLERFLAVRRAVMPICAEFDEIAQSFAAMDDLDNEEEPPVGELLRGVGSVMGSALGFAGAIGELSLVRNRALLEQEMSLGEYIWIYVLAYNSWLGRLPDTTLDGEGDQELSGTEARVMRTLMENHAEALEAAGDPATAELWRDEISRWRRTSYSAPFADGELPEGLPDAFEPYRDELEELFCAPMAAFDLSRIKKKGFSSYSSD